MKHHGQGKLLERHNYSSDFFLNNVILIYNTIVKNAKNTFLDPTIQAKMITEHYD